MREIFKPDPQPEPGKSTERLFYTITEADVGASSIKTTEGTIPVGNVIGRVQRQDVGKRLYRTLDNAGVAYVWQCENNEQRIAARIAELTEQRDEGNDYGRDEAEELAALTGTEPRYP